jgi:hypothetical protein
MVGRIGARALALLALRVSRTSPLDSRASRPRALGSCPDREPGRGRIGALALLALRVSGPGAWPLDEPAACPGRLPRPRTRPRQNRRTCGLRNPSPWVKVHPAAARAEARAHRPGVQGDDVW